MKAFEPSKQTNKYDCLANFTKNQISVISSISFILKTIPKSVFFNAKKSIFHVFGQCCRNCYRKSENFIYLYLSFGFCPKSLKLFSSLTKLCKFCLKRL